MDVTLTAAVITACVTIFVALAGYLITYWNNILLSRRTEQLNRINKQLNEFYGPLYSLVYSSSKSWVTFRKRYRSQIRSYFSNNPPPTEEELQAWRLWMTTVFMPINLRIYELIVSKADLLIERDMPGCLRELCAHVASYQVVLKKWGNNDFSEHTSLIDYPGRELLDYSHRSFKELKDKQSNLLGDKSKND
jgi:hypothetical protein